MILPSLWIFQRPPQTHETLTFEVGSRKVEGLETTEERGRVPDIPGVSQRGQPQSSALLPTQQVQAMHPEPWQLLSFGGCCQVCVSELHPFYC